MHPDRGLKFLDDAKKTVKFLGGLRTLRDIAKGSPYEGGTFQ